jgi:hypothetical protein
LRSGSSTVDDVVKRLGVGNYAAYVAIEIGKEVVGYRSVEVCEKNEEG